MILMGNVHHCKTLAESYGLLSPDTAGAHQKRQAPPCGACCLNKVDYMRERKAGCFSLIFLSTTAMQGHKTSI